MFKRKSGEEPSQAVEEVVNPIPRHLPVQEITLRFYQATWEEIAPGKLYYLPLAQTPRYMFDDAMINQFNKFRELWGTMEIHTPKVRMSNLVMLQDDLRVQSNTPADATAFTQVIYLIKYCPKGVKNYFQLAHCPDGDLTKPKELTYTMKPIKTETGNTQFVQLQGFENFEDLAIIPAKANFTAGFVPRANIALDNDFKITDAYIAPDAPTLLSTFSGNLNTPKEKYMNPITTLMSAKNLDEKIFYKYGDVIEYNIKTNIEGKPLYNTLANNFLEDQYVIEKTTDAEYTYEGEFCWPSRNRPYLSRKDYFAPHLDPVIHGKDVGSLEHTFLCMPPIKKPTGALLGQRCSLLLEQEFAVTFHMSQGVFDTEEIEANQMNQDSSIVIRRNVYPVPDKNKVQPSVLCNGRMGCVEPPGEAQKFQHNNFKRMRALTCYPDSFQGLASYFISNQSLIPDFSRKWVTFQQVDKQPANSWNVSILARPSPTLTLDRMDTAGMYPGLVDYVHKQINDTGILYFYWEPRTPPPIVTLPDGTKYFNYMQVSNIGNMLIKQENTVVTVPNFITIKWMDFLTSDFYPHVANVCHPTRKKLNGVENKICNTFFV